MLSVLKVDIKFVMTTSRPFLRNGIKVIEDCDGLKYLFDGMLIEIHLQPVSLSDLKSMPLFDSFGNKVSTTCINEAIVSISTKKHRA